MQQTPEITPQEYSALIEQNARAMRGLQGHIGELGRQLTGVAQTPGPESSYQTLDPIQGTPSSQQGNFAPDVTVDDGETVGTRQFPSGAAQKATLPGQTWQPTLGTPLGQRQGPYQLPTQSPAGPGQGQWSPTAGLPHAPVQQVPQQQLPQQQPLQQVPPHQLGQQQVPPQNRGMAPAPMASAWDSPQAQQGVPSGVASQGVASPTASGRQGFQEGIGVGQTPPVGQGPGQNFRPGNHGQFGTEGFMDASPQLAQRQAQGSHTRQPIVNLLDEEDLFVLEADMPGVKKEDLDITIYGNTVTIEAEVEKTKEEGALLVGERAPAVFYRTIQLPAEVDADEVDARLADGVLTVEIPKLEPGRGFHRVKF